MKGKICPLSISAIVRPIGFCKDSADLFRNYLGGHAGIKFDLAYEVIRTEESSALPSWNGDMPRVIAPFLWQAHHITGIVTDFCSS